LIRGLFWLCLITVGAVAGLTVRLKDGTVLRGDEESQNVNYIFLNNNGFRITILKSLIDTILETESAAPDAPNNAVETAAPAPTPDGADTAAPLPVPADSPRVAGSAAPSGSPTVPPILKPRSGEIEIAPPLPDLDSLLNNPKAVESLDLSYGSLSELSGKIMFFTNLRRLDLKGNKLRTLPPEIGDLTRLTELDLRLNRFTEIPPELSNLTGLKHLLLTGNDLPSQALSMAQAQLPFTQIICGPASLLRSQDDRPRPLTAADKQTLDSLAVACANGASATCAELGALYEELRDYERAILAYDQGCRMSARDTTRSALTCCMEAAEFYAAFLNDRQRSSIIYKHVCLLGSYFSDEACERIAKKKRKR
jgi:hypothetical protein